ncbi:MAG: DUF3300 domain-containing protein [Candidatus Binataceae bacterium]
MKTGLIGRPNGIRRVALIAGLIAFAATATLTPACNRTEAPSSSATNASPSLTEGPSETPTVAPTPAPQAQASPGPAPGGATPQELQQLVSPIALYPDLLVAQILAASTYPTQIVEADRWVQSNKNLQGQQLADAVNQQPWDPSVKSLTQYPPILDNLNQNLSWTSALGQAYYNQPADVMAAIQTLRNMAQKAGTLKSTPQQTVTEEAAAQSGASSSSGGMSAPPQQTTIIIQPANPSVVYVPEYNPTTAYGAPMAAPPGYSGTDLLLTGLLSFGVGMLVGSLINDGGNHWGCNWGGGNINYNKNVYVSNSNAVPSRWGGYGNRPPFNPNRPYNQGPGRYGDYPRPYQGSNRPVASNPNMPKSYDQPKYQNFANQNERPRSNYGNGANRPGNPNMPKSYDQPKYQNFAGQNQRAPSEAGNNFNRSGANNGGGNRNWGSDSSRGYGGGQTAGQRSWGGLGSAQPGGFTQAASARGQRSFGGGGGGGGGARGGGGGRGRR